MINVVERANTTDLKNFQMVGSALMTKVNIMQTGQNTVIVAMNGRKRIMKFKVGDKVRVRKDLNIDKRYGFLYVTDEMIKEKAVTIAYVYDGYYGIKEDVFMWTDEMFEGLVDDELTAEEAIKIQAEMCRMLCEDCPIRKEKGTYGCITFRVKHPDEVLEIFKQWKKEIKAEIVDLIKIMKEEGDSTTCIYAYEIDAKEENIDEKMDELVKQHYEENGGKIYAKFERICRVKS